MKTKDYLKVRKTIEAGDGILFGANTLLSKIIGNASKSKWTHVEVVDTINGGRIICLGSNQDGVNPHFLSEKMKSHTDFCILKPKRTKEQIEHSLDDVFCKAEQGIKYNFLGGFQELLYRKFGWKTSFSWSSPYRSICSEFFQSYTQGFGMTEYSVNSDHPIFPCDFVNNRNPNNMDLLYEND
jgi:hypothetical protein